MAISLSGIARVIAGAALIAGSIALGGLPALPAIVGIIEPYLAPAGVGLLLSGTGSIIAGMGTGRGGSATASRNPIKAWDVCMGRCRPPLTLVYLNQWGTNFQMLDMVMIVAAHQIQSVDAVLFDQTPIPLDSTKVFAPDGYPKYGTLPGPGLWPTLGGTSYTPTQTNKNGASATRANNIVTVACPFDIPALSVGNPITLHGFTASGVTPPSVQSLNGTFIVEQIISRVPNSSLTFSVLSGGLPVTGGASGYVQTNWPDYGKNVYAEWLLGNQILGQTFAGMMIGTPWQGTTESVSPMFPGDAGFSPGLPTTGSLGAPIAQGQPNPWTPYCSLQGKAAIFLRLQYDSKKFPSGIPQISAWIHGKSNVFDPRLGALTGIGAVKLQSPGTGGYAFGDILSLASGTGGQVFLTSVDTSGNPTSWIVTTSGYGYSLGTAAASGGSGSGAVFNITLLQGISSGVGAVSVAFGGASYKVGDVMQLGGGSMAFVQVASAPGGVVSAVNLLPAPRGCVAGYGYSTGIVPTIFSGTSGGYGCTINITALTGPVSSAIYSENAALCIADFLANPIWGYGAQYLTPGGGITPYNNIDVTALTTAANVCDQAVTLARGGSEPRYACNGVFEVSTRRGDVLKNLLTSCAGRFLYVDGLYSIIPGYWTGGSAPSVDLSAIAAGNPQWHPNVRIRDLFNGVKGTYVSPSNKWQPSDFPGYAQDFDHGYSGPSQYGGDINLAVDLGQRRWKDIHLPFTISAATAQRIAKIELLRMRNQGANGVGTGTFPLTLAAYPFVPWDVIQASSNQYGWANKLLEVTDLRFKAQKQDKSLALSTEMDVQETSADIYSWSVFEELTPQGYQQSTAGAPVKEAVCFPYSPGYVAPLAGDALYPAGASGPGNFGMLVSYPTDAQGNSAPVLQIKGYRPISSLNRAIGPPLISATASATGGTLAPGFYTIGLTSFDGSAAGYKDTPYLDLATVSVPGGQGIGGVPSVGNSGSGYLVGDVLLLVGENGGASVVVTGTTGGISPPSPGQVTSLQIASIGWGCTVGTFSTSGGRGYGCTVYIPSLTPASNTGSISVSIEWGAGDDGGDLYMAQHTISPPQLAALVKNGQSLAQDVMHWQQAVAASATTVSITAFNASTPGGPDTLFDHFGVTWQQVVHTGLWAQQVQAVTSTTVTIAGNGMTTNQWAGYTLSLLGRFDSSAEVPILNMPITSSTASSGGLFILAIGPNSAGVQLPNLTTVLGVADLVGVRGNYTFTAKSFTDPNVANGYYTTGDTSVEAGHLAVVMTGADAGDVVPISSVTNDGSGNSTVFNLSCSFAIIPSPGDVVIIVAPATTPAFKTGTSQVSNSTYGPSVIASLPVQNLLKQVWLFTVRTEDVNGNCCPDFMAPKREIFLFGGQGTRIITSGSWMMLGSDGLVDANCAGGNVTYNCVPFSVVLNQEFTVAKTDTTPNSITVNAWPGGTYNGVSYPADTFSDGTSSWSAATQGASFTFRANGA